MRQLNVRVSDDLVAGLKLAATIRRQSLNSYTSDILSAAIDPEFGGTEAEKTRARLARAGLLLDLPGTQGRSVAAARLKAAGIAAGSGTSLSDLVSEGRR